MSSTSEPPEHREPRPRRRSKLLDMRRRRRGAVPRLEEARAVDPEHPEHRPRRSVSAEEAQMIADGTHPDLLHHRAQRIRRQFGRGRPPGDHGDQGDHGAD